MILVDSYKINLCRILFDKKNSSGRVKIWKETMVQFGENNIETGWIKVFFYICGDGKSERINAILWINITWQCVFFYFVSFHNIIVSVVSLKQKSNRTTSIAYFFFARTGNLFNHVTLWGHVNTSNTMAVTIAVHFWS